MTGECKVYEIVVPNSESYFYHFVEKNMTPENVGAGRGDLVIEIKHAIWDLETLERQGQLDESKRQLLARLRDLYEKEHYVEAYCLLKGYKSALVLRDGLEEVVFNVSEDQVRKIEQEINSYLGTIMKALDALPYGDEKIEFVHECYRLHSLDKERCLEEAKRILSEGRARAQRAGELVERMGIFSIWAIDVPDARTYAEYARPAAMWYNVFSIPDLRERVYIMLNDPKWGEDYRRMLESHGLLDKLNNVVGLTKAYMLIRGYPAALLLRDPRGEDHWMVAFLLDPISVDIAIRDIERHLKQADRRALPA